MLLNVFKEDYSAFLKSNGKKSAHDTFPLHLFARHFKADSKQIRCLTTRRLFALLGCVAVRHTVCHRAIPKEDL